jgi:protein phosphatase
MAENELRIPPRALVLLVGPSGCGKSSFARRHFSETQIVSSDECRRLVADDAADQSASRQAFGVFHAIIRGRLSLGRLTVADATNLRARDRRTLRDCAARYRRPTVAIVFDLPLQLCLERARHRPRVVAPEVIMRHHFHLQQAKPLLDAEGYAAIYEIRPPASSSKRPPLRTDAFPAAR